MPHHHDHHQQQPPTESAADAAAAKYFRHLLKMKRLRHRMACETLQLLASEAALRRSLVEQEMRSKGYTVPPAPFPAARTALDTTHFLADSSSSEEEDR
jgi:hypothetical protein